MLLAHQLLASLAFVFPFASTIIASLCYDVLESPWTSSLALLSPLQSCSPSFLFLIHGSTALVVLESCLLPSTLPHPRFTGTSSFQCHTIGSQRRLSQCRSFPLTDLSFAPPTVALVSHNTQCRMKAHLQGPLYCYRWIKKFPLPILKLKLLDFAFYWKLL